MSELLDMSVRHVSTFSEGKQLFELSCDQGGADTLFVPSTGRYKIVGIEVAPDLRKHGVGKQMLRACLAHAQSLDASYITALIVSRECHDAMVTVFGSEAVIATEIGEYSEPGNERYDTKANLFYNI